MTYLNFNTHVGLFIDYLFIFNVLPFSLGSVFSGLKMEIQFCCPKGNFLDFGN